MSRIWRESAGKGLRLAWSAKTVSRLKDKGPDAAGPFRAYEL